MFARYRRKDSNGATTSPKGGRTNGSLPQQTTTTENDDSKGTILEESNAAAAASLEELNVALNRLEELTAKIAPPPPPTPTPVVTSTQNGSSKEVNNNNNDSTTKAEGSRSSRKRVLQKKESMSRMQYTLRGSMILPDDIEKELAEVDQEDVAEPEQQAKEEEEVVVEETTITTVAADNKSETTNNKESSENNDIPDDSEEVKEVKIAMKQHSSESEEPKPSYVQRSPSAAAADLLVNSEANFLQVSYEDEIEMVELLRRIAEIVVLSERRAGQLLSAPVGNSMDEIDDEAEDQKEEEGNDDIGEKKVEECDEEKDENREKENGEDDEDGNNNSSSSQQSKGESTEESPDNEEGKAIIIPSKKTTIKRKIQKKSKAQRQREYNEDMAFPYLDIFELFCERNGLANIVNIVTGVAFVHEQIDEGSTKAVDEEGGSDKPVQPQECQLPPLSIATQAVQSISILIQNVSRATSLYFLLSNNRVNDLIKLPLHLYERAEINARNAKRKSPKRTPRKQRQQQEPEMSELSTHFVSFLKSLAMRVNAETLQFFLSFPLNENVAKEQLSVEYLERRKVVEFPLYSRALEFCSQDIQDSFVRVTAMNVCMNIIRLVTIHDADDLNKCDVSNEQVVEDGNEHSVDNDNESAVSNDEQIQQEENGDADKNAKNDSPAKALPTSTPSGILHDSATLPIQDRIAIAQYACHPKRVCDLVSPLCARLTSQFGQVEGTVRALEEMSNTPDPPTSSTSPSSSNKKKSKSNNKDDKNSKKNKEQECARLRGTTHDLIANVQDELLLLDDLLKVGLISLNEQAIEMMFATFVYPMLLQPLLLPLHRFSSSKIAEEEESSVSKDGMKKKPVITLQSPLPFTDSASTDDNDTDDKESNVEGPSTASLIASGPPQAEIASSTSNDTDPADKPKYSTCDMDLAPSKTALFGLSVIFHSVSNPTFRHLLLTALLHPQSPEATGGAVISIPPQVTLPSSNEKDFQLEMRMEQNQARQSIESEEFQQHVNVYNFGTESGVAKDVDVESEASCVFILAPALVDMLRKHTSLSDSLKDMQMSESTMATRANPYRSILLSSIAGSDEMASLQLLATAALFEAVSSVDNIIVQKIMFPSVGAVDLRELRLQNDVRRETIKCLCQGIVNTFVTYDGWWKIKFNTVAAQTLMDIIGDKPDCIQLVETIVGDIKTKAASFLLLLPSHLDNKSRDSGNNNKKTGDRQHLDHWLLDRFFFDQADKYTNSVVENVCYLKEHILDDDAKEQYRYGLEVLTSTSIMETSKLLCEDTRVVDNMLVVADARGNTPFHCAASWALASLYLDAFCVKLSKLSSALEETAEENVLQRRLSYISPTESEDDGSQINMSLAHISSKFAIAMLDEGESVEKKAPAHGSAVGLVGKAAFPCVCEVSSTFSSLFTGRTCISNEGIQWQSLYLVVVGKWAVLAEPGHGGTGGEGRVITACRLACLAVKKDTTALANNKTPARRLLVAHASLDPRPPSLFVVDSRRGPNLGSNGLRLTRSRMDLWFEDANAAGHACKVLSAKIAKARARRGGRIASALIG